MGDDETTMEFDAADGSRRECGGSRTPAAATRSALHVEVGLYGVASTCGGSPTVAVRDRVGADAYPAVERPTGCGRAGSASAPPRSRRHRAIGREPSPYGPASECVRGGHGILSDGLTSLKDGVDESFSDATRSRWGAPATSLAGGVIVSARTAVRAIEADVPAGLDAPAGRSCDRVRPGIRSPLHRERQSRKEFAAKPGVSFPVKGHPRGAIRVAQCVESFHPLRGKTVHDSGGERIALAQNLDGPIPTSAVTIGKGSRSHGG